MLFGFFIDNLEKPGSVAKINARLWKRGIFLSGFATMLPYVVNLSEWMSYENFIISLSYVEVLHKISYGCLIGLIIVFCHFERTVKLNKFLSCRTFKFFSKLTFSMYLVHPIIQLYNIRDHHNMQEPPSLGHSVRIICRRISWFVNMNTFCPNRFKTFCLNFRWQCHVVFFSTYSPRSLWEKLVFLYQIKFLVANQENQEEVVKVVNRKLTKQNSKLRSENNQIKHAHAKSTHFWILEILERLFTMSRRRISNVRLYSNIDFNFDIHHKLS